MIYYHMKKGWWERYKVYSLDSGDLFSNHRPVWQATFEHRHHADEYIATRMAVHKQHNKPAEIVRPIPLSEEATNLVNEYRNGT